MKKKKKKIKPGYKKKINWAIEDSNKKKRKIERRQKDRSARKAKKNSSNEHCCGLFKVRDENREDSRPLLFYMINI